MMHIKKILTMPAICISLCGAGQMGTEIVKAEMEFAGAAKNRSVRSAFLEYADSNGVIFNQGQAFNAIQFWQESREDNSQLLWRPSFYAISSSGDLGFTTGPWEFRIKGEDQIRGSGQYTTVWTRTNSGSWKFLVDMGVSYRPSLFANDQLHSFNGFTSAGDIVNAVSVDQAFNEQYQKAGASAYEQVLADTTWLNTDWSQPLQSKEMVMAEINRLPDNTSFHPVAGGISRANDLGFVYGNVVYKDKKETYLRIWAHTKGGWKILLQVIKK